MSIALVQALGSAKADGAATSLTIPVGKTVTAGNTLILALGINGAVDSGMTVTDSMGNTWTLIQYASDASLQMTTMLYRAEVTSTGTLATITAAFSSARPGWAAQVAEFSGCGSTRMYGSWSGYTYFSGGSIYATPRPANGTDGNTATTPTVGDLWVGAFGALDNPDTFSVSTPAGVSLVAPAVSGNGITAGMSYWLPASVVSTTLSITHSSSAFATVTGVGAAIQAAPAAPKATVLRLKDGSTPKLLLKGMTP